MRMHRGRKVGISVFLVQPAAKGVCLLCACVGGVIPFGIRDVEDRLELQARVMDVHPSSISCAYDVSFMPSITMRCVRPGDNGVK